MWTDHTNNSINPKPDFHLKFWPLGQVLGTSNMKNIEDMVRTHDIQPFHYLDCIMPTHTPKPPAPDHLMTVGLLLAASTPCVASLTWPHSSPSQPHLVADPMEDMEHGENTTLKAINRHEPKPGFNVVKKQTLKVLPCLHCLFNISISSPPNYNLHKHQQKCTGLPEAQRRRVPGRITPDEDPQLAALCRNQLHTLLVGEIISRNLLFSIFRRSFDAEGP
ncbi:hypothetical protein DFH28DRAFT_938083 [Melampsora americana]|nr:hypothetical protein DFH28DRAFT_938083 [Melampsora americana]